MGLKIRCPQGRAGSTPALGTNHLNSLQTSRPRALLGTTGAMPPPLKQTNNGKFELGSDFGVSGFARQVDLLVRKADG